MFTEGASSKNLRGFARVVSIQKLIGANRFPSLEYLAAELCVDKRTIRRDIAFLRDEFNAPIKYSRLENGYYFCVKGWDLPLQKFSEGDLLAFFIAENALRLTGQSAQALQLRYSLAKIASLLPDEVMVNLSTLGETISFENSPYRSVEPQMLQLVAKCAIRNETISFDYYSPHNQQHTERIADPYLLHNFAGDWYAISYDHGRRDFRDFHVGRMSKIKQTGSGFEKHSRWNPDEYLARGFSMMRGGRLTEVVIHFDNYQAQWIRERGVFHPDEIREEMPDRSMKLSFKLGENGLEAVARFCMQYIGHCRIEKPKRLREMILKELDRGNNLNK